MGKGAASLLVAGAQHGTWPQTRSAPAKLRTWRMPERAGQHEPDVAADTPTASVAGPEPRGAMPRGPWCPAAGGDAGLSLRCDPTAWLPTGLRTPFPPPIGLDARYRRICLELESGVPSEVSADP